LPSPAVVVLEDECLPVALGKAAAAVGAPLLLEGEIIVSTYDDDPSAVVIPLPQLDPLDPSTHTTEAL
jgi:hypothetical protein